MIIKVVKTVLFGMAGILLLLLLLILQMTVQDAMTVYDPVKEMISEEFLGAYCLPYILCVFLISFFFYAVISKLTNEIWLIRIWRIVFIASICMLIVHITLKYTGHLMTYEGWFARGCESNNPPWNCPGAR